MNLNFSVYRYNPDVDSKPYMKQYTLEVEEGSDMMVLDALICSLVRLALSLLGFPLRLAFKIFLRTFFSASVNLNFLCFYLFN